MNRLTIIILLTCITGTILVNAQPANGQVPDATYYLIRHAEKDTGRNPGLTMAGYSRAGDLYRELKNKKISKIYVSQFRRSQLTADSLRIYMKIDTVHYMADNNGEDLLNKLLLQKGKQKNVLIIGHSNTVPAILKRLGVTALDINEIPDEEYDNLFVVTVRNKKVSLKWLKFGKTSMPASIPGKMKPL
ncbi:MAG: phosphoglycerate mutase family protein [Ferruginibacter sp.]